MIAIRRWSRGGVLALLLAVFVPTVALGEPKEKPAGSEPATAAASKPGAGYYVEFRVAEIGTYGHSYVAYGRLNAKGQPAEHKFADLHPIGNYALMALGHVVPVPATTRWDPDVEKLPISASWRRKLTPAEYGKLVAAIQKSRLDPNPTWNAAANNCNHYVASLAKALGLRTPSNFQVSYTFIPALRDLNEAKSNGQTEPAKRKHATRE